MKNDYIYLLNDQFSFIPIITLYIHMYKLIHKEQKKKKQQHQIILLVLLYKSINFTII